MTEVRVTLYFGQFSSWITFINKYIIPPAALVVLVTNACVVFVYFKQYKITRNVTRKMSSVLYIAIASSNILAVLPKAFLYMYFFYTDLVTYFIPFPYCWTWHALLRISSIPHVCSIWFVTILSLQRYMVITHPFTIGQFWTMKNTSFAMMLIGILSLLLNLPFAFGCKFLPRDINFNSTSGENISGQSCDVQYADWIGNSGQQSEIALLCLRLFFIILLSSSIILYCDFSLIAFLHSSSKIRKLLVKVLKYDTEICLLKQQIKANAEPSILFKRKITRNMDTSDTNHQILLIVTLSLIVFIVEIPYGVILSLYLYCTVEEIPEPFAWFWIGPIRTIFDASVVFSYPSLFILSCIMCRRFRKLLWSSCKKRTLGRGSPKTCSTQLTSIRDTSVRTNILQKEKATHC